MDFERNLNELFDYTQGLIQELRQKSQPLQRSDFSRAQASPMLGSFKQAREDSLQKRAIQKKQQNLSQEASFEENMLRMNDLEERWNNQKTESVMGASNSFIMNTRQIRSRETISTNFYTPYKTSAKKMDKEDSDFLAAPIDDFSVQNKTYCYQLQIETKQLPRKSNSVERNSKQISAKHALSKICQRRNSDSYDKINPDNQTRKSTLKPSRSMTDIKIKSSKGTDISFISKTRKVPVLREVQLFLENHNLLSAANSSASRKKTNKSMERQSKANVLESSFELRGRLGRKSLQKCPNTSLIDITLPIENLPKNDALSGEISIIEPKEPFELDLDFAGATIKLFSKRSSLANETWLQNADTHEMFKGNLERNKREINSRMRPQYVQKDHAKQANVQTRGNQNKTPLKNLNMNHKINSSTAVLNSDSKWQNKTPQRSAQKASRNTQIQKENENNQRNSVYNQIISKVQLNARHPSDNDKRAVMTDKKRSLSTKRPESKGRVEGRLDKIGSNRQRMGREQNTEPMNEVDRLYKQIMDKLTKERALMA